MAKRSNFNGINKGKLSRACKVLGTSKNAGDILPCVHMPMGGEKVDPQVLLSDILRLKDMRPKAY